MIWLLLLFPTFAVYGAGAFICWDWNPNVWGNEFRGILMLVDCVFTIPVLGALLESVDK